MYQIIMFFILNLCNIIFQIYLKRAGKKYEVDGRMEAILAEYTYAIIKPRNLDV